MHVQIFRKNVILFKKWCTFNIVHLLKLEYQDEMQYIFKTS